MLKLPSKIQFTIDTLYDNGFEAYIVGGCVRDMLLGKQPFDFDITTSATPEQVMSLFAKTVPTGIRHGTVTVIIENENIEVTTFRTEVGYKDNRHPDKVQFVTSLEADISRRDFTINAMAFNNRSGLIDLFNGQKDLKNHILRTVGNPYERFSEDALRILRLFRFSSTLNFSCEQETFNAALKLSKNLETISRERITTELKKSIAGKNIKIFDSLIKQNALMFIGINSSPDWKIMDSLIFNPELALFAFFYLSGDNVLSILEALKVSNKFKNYSLSLLKLLSMPFPKTKSEIKTMLSLCNPEIFNDYLCLINALKNTDISNSQILLKEIINLKEPYLISHLALNGQDLNQLGITGEKTGRTLEHLKNLVIDNPTLNNKEKLIEFIDFT